MAMTSFNTLNRVPSTANKWLMRKVLREDLGFDGVLISDYSAVEELFHMVSQRIREKQQGLPLRQAWIRYDVGCISSLLKRACNIWRGR